MDASGIKLLISPTVFKLYHEVFKIRRIWLLSFETHLHNNLAYLEITFHQQDKHKIEVQLHQDAVELICLFSAYSVFLIWFSPKLN